jgi:hypothetical protein
MTNTTSATDILSVVKDKFGISMFTSTDSCGSYLHARLDGGAWLVATDACDYNMTLDARIDDERERREYWHDIAESPESCTLGLGWSVGIYRNCTACGDDHPATHDDDGELASVVYHDKTADYLPNAIRGALAEYWRDNGSTT